MNKDYIPQNTNDVIAVERLKILPFESVREDVPALLEWLQDGHWPVAEGINEYFSSHVNEIAEELIFVLESDDGMWKYFIIYGLLSRSQYQLSPNLIKVLRRIAEHPSKIDAEDAVDEAANDMLSNKFLCGELKQSLKCLLFLVLNGRFQRVVWFNIGLLLAFT